MFDALLSAGGQVLQPAVLFAMAIALPIGLIVGLLPGLSGLSAFSFLIPFTFGMHPLVGLGFLLAAHAAVSQGGSITAILIGVPGEIPNAATVIDGYQLAKRGRAGYALGAALTASALGGLFGCLVLALVLPIIQPVILSFASPENFFISLAGIAFIAVLSTGAPLRGLIAGAVGILLSLFGYDPTEGVPRFWMGFEYMLDGVRLVPLAMGLFAIPEILSMTSSGKTIAQAGMFEPISFRQSLEGARAVFKHWGVFLRSSCIGTGMGLMPGVGSATATFVAYALERQTAKDGGTFGKGDIRGVIAPESASNAKEGGALIPTLALGIPSGAAMALLLGAFLIFGLQPGPEFLAKHMDLALGLAIICAIGNVGASILTFAMSKWLVYVTRVPGNLLAPVLLVLVAIGCYAADNNINDVFFVFLFGALGVAMERLDFNRPALLLGFVLGETIERNFAISIKAYGALFFWRPISMTIIILALLCMVWPNRHRIALAWRRA